jgi:hypothetical protein
MTRYALVSWRAVAMVLASLTTAACTAGLLWAVALAPDQIRREDAIERRLSEARALPNPASAPSLFAPGAVCDHGLEPASVLLSARLTDAAKASGVSVTRREIAISPDGSNGLSSVLLEATFDGSHASGLNFLKILADSAPTIFVEELDGLPADGDRAQWRLKGRIYCAIRLGQ